jgi:hypothetical protein
MKGLILSVVLCLTIKSNAQVIVSGNFIKSKATFTVYEMEKDSTYSIIQNSTKVKRNYTLELEDNKTYLVKFISADNKVKAMKFISYEVGLIDLDIEFSSSKNAYITIKDGKAKVKRTSEQLLAVITE